MKQHFFHYKLTGIIEIDRIETLRRHRSPFWSEYLKNYSEIAHLITYFRGINWLKFTNNK